AAAVPEVERTRHAYILAAADTKRGDLYLQLVTARDLSPRTEPVALPPAEIGSWLPETDVVVTGDGAAAALEVLPNAAAASADPIPDAVVIARLAAARTPDPAGPLPLYVL